MGSNVQYLGGPSIPGHKDKTTSEFEANKDKDWPTHETGKGRKGKEGEGPSNM